MYERFTDRAKQVLQLANVEAHRFGHEYIATEHILIGMVKERFGVAGNVLKGMNVNLRKVRREVKTLVKCDSHTGTTDELPLAKCAKYVIEYSMQESQKLNHNYVGTEHLLLGLLREQDGVATQVLRNLGLKLEDVRSDVLNQLGHFDCK